MESRKLYFTAPLETDLRTEDLDTDLGDTEVLSETRYSLISPGTETMSVQTAPADAFPRGTGYASVDRVLEVGAEVEGIEPGDAVFTMGQHASHHRQDVTEMPVVPVPDGLDERTVPFARLCGVGMPAIQTADVNPPALAGVFGLGLVGNLACQVATAFGYDVVGFDLLSSRRSAASEVGVDALDPTAHDDLGGAIAETAPRDAPELVLECSGTQSALADAVDVAAVDAELVQVGFAWEQTSADVTAYDVQAPLFEKYLTIRSGWEWQIPRLPEAHEPYSHHENYAHAMGLLARGDVAVDPLVTHEVAPDEVQGAYEGLAGNKEEYLGVLIDWT